jgi:hypothetical protein
MVVMQQSKVQVSALWEQFWRFYEQLHNSVYRSDDCLDLWVDCFSRDQWTDSHSSCLGRGVAHFAFHSR